MSRMQLQTYKVEDFREADRLGRIQMWLMQFDLFDGMMSDADQNYYNDLHQAYQLCYMETRKSIAIRLIQSNIRGCESFYRANRLYGDMQDLFGRFLKKNKEFQLSVVIEKIYHHVKKMEDLAALLEQEEKLVESGMMRDMASKRLMEAAKLEGLDKVETGFDPSEFEFPEIEVTSDPDALVVDVDHEEVE